MLFGVQPIVGATRAEALDKQAEHNALVPLEGGLAILSGHLDFDLSTLPLDTIMAHRTEPKLQRMQTRYRSMTGELLTLRQVAQNHGQAVGLPQMVGTPSDVADQLEAYFDRSAATASCSRRSIRRARSRNSSTWSCPSCSGADASGGTMQGPRSAII